MLGGAGFLCLFWWRVAGEVEESFFVFFLDNLGSSFEFNFKISNKKYVLSMSMICCIRVYENISRGEGV